MFKRETEPLGQVINVILRRQGLETPLLQKRLMDAWPRIAGKAVERYTRELYIHNQVLHVRLQNPALRADLMMVRSQLVTRLNHEVQADNIITDIVFH